MTKLGRKLQSISKEEFEDYYFSHSRPETMEHFGMGSTVFLKFCKYHSIVKPNECIVEQRRKTTIERYGYDNAAKDVNFAKKMKASKKERYGEDFFINRVKDLIKNISSRTNSKINNSFALYLMALGIDFEREFILGKYVYDFKIDKYLIELDPYPTHNSTWGIFGNPKSDTYHRDKTLNALQNGFICVHIFDWMDVDAVMFNIINYTLKIIDTGKPVRHIYDTHQKSLVNSENADTVIIYDDGFNIIY